ncbi:hypothetical protein [Reichenbachiella sp.]|uniref:hypothetical protein n=1 Tax=Reichenbachiella sp. TaxID=2184521 RepID=UPI003B5C6BB4
MVYTKFGYTAYAQYPYISSNIKNYMKNWNNTGKVKATILFILAIINLFNPIESPLNFSFMLLIQAVITILFAAFMVPIAIKINKVIFGLNSETPNWNHSILSFKRALSGWQFMAYFFISTGVSMILGALIHYQTFNAIGIVAISFGTGILWGIKRTAIN